MCLHLPEKLKSSNRSSITFDSSECIWLRPDKACVYIQSDSVQLFVHTWRFGMGVLGWRFGMMEGFAPAPLPSLLTP